MKVSRKELPIDRFLARPGMTGGFLGIAMGVGIFGATEYPDPYRSKISLLTVIPNRAERNEESLAL